MASNLFVYNVSPPTITINQIDWGGNPITCDSLCPCTPGDNSTYTIPSTGTFNLEFHVSNGVLNGCITVTDSLGFAQNQDIANSYSGIATFANVTYDGITDIQVVINDNLCAPIPTPTETPSVSPTPTSTASQYSVTSFGYGTAIEACGSSTNTTIYASPGSTDPIVGMIFYANPSLTTPYVGNGSGVWLLLEQNSNKWAVQIDTNGELLNKSDCSVPPTPSSTPVTTPSSTPVTTPSSTPTSSYRYSAASAEDACTGGLTMTNVILYGGAFCDGTGIQCDEFALEAAGINVWVSNGTNSRYVVIDDPNISGTATYVGPCEACGPPAPTSTPTMTPSPTPSGNVCQVVNFCFGVQNVSPTPSPTPTITPSNAPGLNTDASGVVTFTTINGEVVCPPAQIG